MLSTPIDELRARAAAVVEAVNRLAGWRAELVDGSSAVGGGSAPGVELPTPLVALVKQGLSASALDAQCRRLTPPLIARIDDDRLVLDLRTVAPEDDQRVTVLLAQL